jgi:nicotinate-nucleotide adenylyltransferase
LKIGLFFGSFNPIHIGHLIIANLVVEETEVDQVWFIVSPLNPLKSSSSLLHEFDRLDMVEAAINDNYNLKASDVEFRMPRPSYTIHTLTYLSEKYPQHQFKLIIGEDNLHQFKNWKNHDTILNEYGLLVYPRPGQQDSPLKDHPGVEFIEAPVFNISASFIRKCIRENKSIRYMVPDQVWEIINSRKYYLK